MDKEGKSDTSDASLEIDLPPVDTDAIEISVEDPLTEEDLEGIEDLDEIKALEDTDAQDDLESLSDKPSDEIAKALEDLEDKARDKITVVPVKSYDNSYEMRQDVLTDNNRKAGVYR